MTLLRHRFLITSVVFVSCALASASTASAAPPVPRLVYTKAVAYVTAQARAHHAKVVCDPYTANRLTGRWACTFGTKWQLRLEGGQDCQLAASMWYGPDFLMHTESGWAPIALCRAGWQKDLPLPWTTAAT